MVLLKNLKFKIYKNKPVNLSIGSFDALHKGHLKLLNTLVKESKKDKVLSVVITFENDPKKLLFKKDKGFITPPLERIKLFKELGIDILIILKFTKKFAQISAEDFIKKLNSLFRINKFIVGKDFKFGKDNKGDINLLRKFNKVKSVKILYYKNKKIGTSFIKDLILKGEMEKVSFLLGRDYSIIGRVVKGEGLGRKLNFPTANLKLEYKNQILPKNGVYLSYVRINNKLFYGMTYIGIKHIGRKRNNFVIETYIFNFSGNLYNKKIKIFLKKMLRAEMKFSNLNKLVEQMKKDEIKALSEVKKYGITKRS